MRKANIENLLSEKIKTSQLYLDSLTHRSASNKNNERWFNSERETKTNLLTVPPVE